MSDPLSNHPSLPVATTGVGAVSAVLRAAIDFARLHRSSTGYADATPLVVAVQDLESVALDEAIASWWAVRGLRPETPPEAGS